MTESVRLKALIKDSYTALAEKATQGRACWAAFRLARGLRLFAELLIPQRFFRTTVAVADPANGRRASFTVWGNKSGVWYLSRCFERSGLAVHETRDSQMTSTPPSIKFVWHNCAVSWKFRQNGWLVLPGQVRSQVDLSRGMDAVRARFLRSAKAAVRSITRQGLVYHIVPCDEILRRFYDEMYLPYREVRFAGNPIVKDFESVRRFAKGSVMLAVTDSRAKPPPKLEDMLGALIIRQNGKSATADLPGLNGDPLVALERGVVEALYYFSLEWCSSRGVERLDLGQSHPFLDDGILRFKTKWGATVEATQAGVHNLAVRFVDNGWLGRHFLANHPPIVYCSHKPPTADRKLPTPGLIGVARLPAGELSYRGLRRLWRSRMINGLRELLIVSDPDSPDEAQRLAAQFPGVRILPCYDLRYLAEAVNSLSR